MATTIRELVVRLDVETNESGVKKFDGAIRGLRKAMLAAVGAATALGGVITGVLGRKMVRLGMQTEAAEISIAGVFATLSDDVKPFNERLEHANGLLEEFGKRSISSPATRQDFRTIFERTAPSLVGMQLDDEEIADFVQQSVPAALAFSGGNFEQAGGDFARILQGRAGQRVKTFAPIRQELLDATDTGSIEEFNKLAQQSPRVVFDALNEVLSGMSDVNKAFGSSVTGLFASLQEQVDKFSRDVFVEFKKGLLPVLQSAVDWFLANQRIIETVASRIGATLAQAIQKASKRFVSLVTQAREFAAQIDDIVREFTDWQTVLSTIASAFGAVAVIKFAPALILGIKGIVAAIGVLSIKIVAIVALVAGLALVIQDLVVWFKGGESVIGSFVSGLSAGEGRLSKFIDLIKAIASSVATTLAPTFWELIDVFKAVGGVIASAAKLWWAVISRRFKMIADIVLWWFSTVWVPVFNRAIKILAPFWTALLNGFEFAFDMISSVLDMFTALVEGDFGKAQEIIFGMLDRVKEYFEEQFHLIAFAIVNYITTIIEPLRIIFEWIQEKLDGTIGKVGDAIGAVKGLAGGASDAAGGLFDNVAGFFGAGDGAANDVAGTARSQANANTAIAAGMGDVQIEVNGDGADPTSIADAVAQRQEDIYQRNLRQASAAFGGGDI